MLLKISKMIPPCLKQLPDDEHTGEFWLPCDEYTGETTS